MAMFRQRLATMLEGVNTRLVLSFWLFGEIPSSLTPSLATIATQTSLD